MADTDTSTPMDRELIGAILKRRLLELDDTSPNWGRVNIPQVDGSFVRFTRPELVAQIKALAAAEARDAAPSASRAPQPRPPCMKCGGPHPFDTVLPSEVWNENIRANGLPDYLCMTCIIEQFSKSNESFNCELWGGLFNGVPVSIHFNNRRARHSQMLVAVNTELRHRLSEAERACKQFRAVLLSRAEPPTNASKERFNIAQTTAEAITLGDIRALTQVRAYVLDAIYKAEALTASVASRAALETLLMKAYYKGHALAKSGIGPLPHAWELDKAEFLTELEALLARADVSKE